MRLSCPNCATLYEVPDGALPAAGQHVQCTECHTRWFVKGPEPRALLSEDEILARLETRKPLTLVSGGRKREAAAEPVPEPARDFVREGRDAAPPAEEEPAAAAPEPAPAAGRFGVGLLAALALAGLALAAYAEADTLALRVPAIAPAIGLYAGAVDALREGLEAVLAPLRE